MILLLRTTTSEGLQYTRKLYATTFMPKSVVYQGNNIILEAFASCADLYIMFWSLCLYFLIEMTFCTLT